MQRTAVRSIPNTLSHASFLSFRWFFFFFFFIKTETQVQEHFTNQWTKTKIDTRRKKVKKKFFLLCTLTSVDEIYKDDKKKILYGFIIRIKILLIHSFWTFQNTLQNFSTLWCRSMSLHVVCNGKRMYLNTFIINI